MPNDLEHERNRFRTMTVRQLETRLNKITDLTKLQNFVLMADRFNLGGEGVGYRDLAIAARARISFLWGPRNVLPLLPSPRDPSGIRTASTADRSILRDDSGPVLRPLVFPEPQTLLKKPVEKPPRFIMFDKKGGNED